MKRLPLFLGTFVLILPVALAGCHGPAASSEEEVPPAPVQAQTARKMVLGEWTDLLGTTQPLPNHSARLSAAVEGQVLAVLGDGKGATVVEGQQVKAGQVIIQLDDRVPRANREKLLATLEELEEQQKQAGYSLELATIDVNRLKELMQNNPASGPLPLVSRVDFAKAGVMLKDAQSKQKSVAARQTIARADLKALDQQLEFYTLCAPIAGRLGIIQVVPGQTLTPGTSVAEVVNLDPIDVLCYAPPQAAARIALDQPGKLTTGEMGDGTVSSSLPGKVVFSAVHAQPETGNIAVKVRFPNPDHRLWANAIIRVQILTRPEQDRLTIPETALVEDRDIPFVLAVQDIKTAKKGEETETLGKVKKLQANLGVRDRDQGSVEILGLEDPATKAQVSLGGLQFITAGGNGLQDGDTVKLQKEEAREQKEH